MLNKVEDLPWVEFDERQLEHKSIVLECELQEVSSRGLAIRIVYDTLTEWLPLSQIIIMDKPVTGEIARVEIPMWIAEEKGFIVGD